MVKNLKKSKTLKKRCTKKAFKGYGKNSAEKTRKTIEGKYRRKSSNTSSNSPKKTNNNRFRIENKIIVNIFSDIRSYWSNNFN